MAINGSIQNTITITTGSGLANVVNTYTVTLSWSRTSFSAVTNSSTIAWTLSLYLKDAYGASNVGSTSKPYSININGATFSGNADVGIKRGETKTLASGSTTIPHNIDGTKTFSYSFSQELNGNKTTSASGSATLDRITRASSITCTTVNIGVAPVITINAQDTSFKHTLSYGFGDQEHGYITGTIVSKTSAKQISNFVWPVSFYQVIPNSRSGIGTIFCDTYDSNGTKIGEQTRCNFTANVNEGSSTPVFDSGYPIIKDTNSITKALTGDESILIRYMSTAYVEIGAQGRNYATIARQKVKNGTAYHEEYTNDLVSISFGNVPNGLFSFELEDSRGYITKPGRDLSAAGRFIEYFHPTCSIGNDKPDTHGNLTINCRGSWFNSSFGATDNSITVQYRYKLGQDEWANTESEWHPMTVSISGNSYDATASFAIPNFDYKAGYVYEARVTDKLFTSHSTEYEVKSSALFSWSDQDFEFNVPVKFNAGAEGIEGGSGGSTGDLSQYALKSDIPTVLPNPYALTINGQTYDGTRAVTVAAGEGSNLSSGGVIDGDLIITGNLHLKGAGNYGNNIYMGDGTYVSFSENTDDNLSITATSVTLAASDTLSLYGGNVKVNGSPLASGTNGTWTPSLSSSAISSYTVRQGWYQQVGNVVTLGFNIKATCNSGYNSTSISISGLPVTPRYDASGGGMCSGAYVSAGFNFECWVASTSGTITGRVQACNNTTAANLSTSASGLFYRSGGGEITLSGTICYIIN